MNSDDSSPSQQCLDQLTELFRLLSDSTRLKILLVLAKGERNVTSLCTHLKLPQPTVSHHLGLLRMNNLIGNRRAGKQVFYGLNGLNRELQGVLNRLEFEIEDFAVSIAPRE